MTKRKHNFHGHLHGGYGGHEGTEHRGMRRHRASKRAKFTHSEIVHVPHMGDHTETSKGNKHEAHLIPGLSRKVWGFPNTIITKLRYCDYYTMTSTAGSVYYQVMLANSIFDPDVTGVGHQPMYRDTYAGIYDHYTVLGSKITVHFTNTSSTGTVIAGVRGDDDGTGSTTLTTIMEGNNGTWVQLGQNGSGQDTKTVTCTFEPLADFGVDAKDDGFSSTAVGSNPTEGFYYHIFAANTVAGTSTILASIEIEYTVKFSELATQAGS